VSAAPAGWRREHEANERRLRGGIASVTLRFEHVSYDLTPTYPLETPRALTCVKKRCLFVKRTGRLWTRRAAVEGGRCWNRHGKRPKQGVCRTWGRFVGGAGSLGKGDGAAAAKRLRMLKLERE
jgi:hypothetical protein